MAVPVRSRVLGASHRSACGIKAPSSRPLDDGAFTHVGSARAGKGADNGAMVSLFALALALSLDRRCAEE